MRILIGKVVKPQGVRGELKVYPADTNLDIYKNVKTIYFDNSNMKIKLQSLSLRQGFIYIKTPDIKDRNMAELYRNKQVFTDDSQLTLKEDTYFVDDLLDKEVVDQSGNFVGTIVDIESYGAADVITILQDSREYKIPFLTSIVLNVTQDYVVINLQKYNEVKICE